MKIGILGAGAMGLLYGAYLSQENEVTLICTNQEKVDKINQEGLFVTEKDGTVGTYNPKAILGGSKLEDLDLMILFVKATASEIALQENLSSISEKTILLSLQNGSGHELLLEKFVPQKQIAIGISQEGSFLESSNKVRHTGSGSTLFGKPYDSCESLDNFAKTCEKCGFKSRNTNEIKSFIWEKLIINASSSVMSAVLSVEQGYCYQNQYAWDIVQKLVEEMLAVAKADGIVLDLESQVKRVETLLIENPEGVPSICVDLRHGKKTEVKTISGSVIEAGKRLGIPTPTHQIIVSLVLAMEGRTSEQ